MLERSFILALLPLSLSACVGFDDHTNDLMSSASGACALLEGRTFTTAQPQHDCGPVPEGTDISCNWTVSFAAHDKTTSSYTYRYSDVGEGGTVKCEGSDMIVLKVADVARGSYDPNTDELTWYDVSYVGQ
jgi:hypothetical protein